MEDRAGRLHSGGVDKEAVTPQMLHSRGKTHYTCFYPHRYSRLQHCQLRTGVKESSQVSALMIYHIIAEQS